MACFQPGLLPVPGAWEPEEAGEGGAGPGGGPDSPTGVWPFWKPAQPIGGSPEGVVERTEGVGPDSDTINVFTTEGEGPSAGVGLGA